MAIHPCKDCGGPVSDDAKSCPRCGAKQRQKTSKAAIIVATVFLVGIIYSIFAQSSSNKSDNKKESQKWFVAHDVDQMTDNKNVYITLLSDTVLVAKNDLSNIDEPQILMRCQEGKTDFLINFKQPLSPEYGNPLRRTIKFRLDNNKASEVIVNSSQDDLRVYFVPEPIKKLKEMLGHKKLLVSYQAHRVGEQIIKFDISDMKSQMRPLRELCNW
ncbi:type VI secretion system-associated protein TagO [Acinetobacter ursingii]|uniref:type VI secretion system-associated protein TagO n=1 Tax=Acinetobacter ursingii TaxID=108980 RepID=UPI00124CB86F|nr:type VI secretion system-associated protein TagO [Acinetobacter ursingii]